MTTIFWSENDNFINKEFFKNYESSLRRFNFLKNLPEIKICHIENDTLHNQKIA